MHIVPKGEKVNLSETTLLLTRPASASARFAQSAARLGAFRRVVVSPVLEIVPLVAVADVPEMESFAFTSENGVAAVAALARGQRAWCVGARTARAARLAGFDAVSANGDVGMLAELILSEGGDRSVLHVSGRHHRGDLVRRLRAGGLRAERLEVYDQVARPLSHDAQEVLMTPGDVAAPVFSPRTATLLDEAAGTRRARVHVVAISKAAATPWRQRSGECCVVAQKPDAEGVLAAMGSLFDADCSA